MEIHTQIKDELYEWFDKNHNFRWLPETPINSLSSNNKNSILRRVDSAIIEASKINNEINKLHYNDRLGIGFPKKWAKEIIFNINEDGDLDVSIYPGNTKSQGYSLFSTSPNFSSQVMLLSEPFDIYKNYHIKFTSFQKYFSGLWFGEKEMKENLYTKNNFYKYSGRKKRGSDWEEIAGLFDKHLQFDWRQQCNWDDKIINSGKSQFDLSFGYSILMKIPFSKLKELDIQESDLSNLSKLIIEIYNAFKDKLLNAQSKKKQ